jgi:hypothetical protein
MSKEFKKWLKKRKLIDTAPTLTFEIMQTHLIDREHKMLHANDAVEAIMIKSRCEVHHFFLLPC